MKSKLGSGGRFKALKEELARKGAYNPGADKKKFKKSSNRFPA